MSDYGDESEACPRCHRVNWGQTPAGESECASCGYAERALGLPPGYERRVIHKDGNIRNNEIGNVEIVDAPEEKR